MAKNTEYIWLAIEGGLLKKLKNYAKRNNVDRSVMLLKTVSYVMGEKKKNFNTLKRRKGKVEYVKFKIDGEKKAEFKKYCEENGTYMGEAVCSYLEEFIEGYGELV